MRLSRIIALAAMLIASHQAFSQMSDVPEAQVPLQGLKYRWALGFDVLEQIMHAENDFANVAWNHRQGMDLFAAWRARGPFGLEFGYNWTTDKQKNFTTVPGTRIFGAIATTTSEYQCKMRIEDFYIDGYWHFKYRNIVELKTGVGIGFERQNMRFYFPVQGADPVAVALFNLGTGTTLVARFNLGLQSMLTKRIGGRVLFLYKTTSAIKAVKTLPGVNPHMFGNSYSVGLGLFYTITGYYND